MRKKISSSAAPALACLISSFLFLAGGASPAAAYPWGPGALAASPDGKHLYMDDPWLSGVAVIDTATNQLAGVLPFRSGPGVSALAVSPDGAQLYGIASGSNELLVISLAAGKTVATVKVGRLPGSLVVSPDGTRVYVTNSESNTVSVVDTASDQVTATIKVGTYPNGLAISPDGQRLYVANTGFHPASPGSLTATVSVIDTAKNQVIEGVHVHSRPVAVAVSRDGQRVYVTHADPSSSQVDVINPNPLGLTRPENPTPGGYASTVVVSPDGKQLYIISSEFPIVAAIDLAGSRVSGVAPPDGYPTALVVSPDGRRLYMAAANSGTITVIDAATLQLVATIDVKKRPAGQKQ